MGKTQIALRYAAEHRDKFSAIHYVDSSSESNARIGFRDIGQRYVDMAMGLEEHEEHQRALQRLQLAPYVSPKGQISYDSIHLIEITKAVNGILEQDGNDNWLLILDNMDELDEFPIQDFLPNTPFRRFIITTRLTAAIRLGYAIEVDAIDEVDGVAILFNSARLRNEDNSGI
jgi:pimeloyl-ACP methyl ester carboxylesterase